MSSPAHRRATAAHRRRASQRGLVRVEVQARQQDAVLIKALAETLRTGGERADSVRASLEPLLPRPTATSALEIFASALPDEAFDGVFDLARDRSWRETPL